MNFTIDTITVPPASVRHFRLPAVALPSGAGVEIPVTVVHGAEPGPVLLVTGATHGIELVGTRALLSLVSALDPRTLAGTVISVPVTNPLAFDQSSYGSPQDGMHMGLPCYWPASPEGSATRRLGAALRPLFDAATHYIDLHNNVEPAVPMSMRFEDSCSSESVRQQQRLMADSFGFTSVRMTEPDDDTAQMVGRMDGHPAAAASAHGKPGLMVELVDTRGYLGHDLGVAGVRNVMSALGMLTDPVTPQDAHRLDGDFTFHGLLAASASGIAMPVREPGALLEKGEEVVHIVDMTGAIVDTVRMPITGFAWAYLASPHQRNGTMAVNGGHALAFVAKLEA